MRRRGASKGATKRKTGGLKRAGSRGKSSASSSASSSGRKKAGSSTKASSAAQKKPINGFFTTDKPTSTSSSTRAGGRTKASSSATRRSKSVLSKSASTGRLTRKPPARSASKSRLGRAASSRVLSPKKKRTTSRAATPRTGKSTSTPRKSTSSSRPTSARARSRSRLGITSKTDKASAKKGQPKNKPVVLTRKPAASEAANDETDVKAEEDQPQQSTPAAAAQEDSPKQLNGQSSDNKAAEADTPATSSSHSPQSSVSVALQPQDEKTPAAAGAAGAGSPDQHALARSPSSESVTSTVSSVSRSSRLSLSAVRARVRRARKPSLTLSALEKVMSAAPMLTTVDANGDSHPASPSHSAAGPGPALRSSSAADSGAPPQTVLSPAHTVLSVSPLVDLEESTPKRSATLKLSPSKRRAESKASPAVSSSSVLSTHARAGSSSSSTCLQVFVHARLRPTSDAKDSNSAVTVHHSSPIITVSLPISGLQDSSATTAMKYAVDKVWRADSPGAAFTKCFVDGLGASVSRGLDTTVVAYGQTASGKSHTLLGPANVRDGLFAALLSQALEQFKSTHNIVCTGMELQHGFQSSPTLFDRLAKDEAVAAQSTPRGTPGSSLTLAPPEACSSLGVCVQGLVEFAVTKPADVDKCCKALTASAAKCEFPCHSIYTIVLRPTKAAAASGDAAPNTVRVHCVDLAPSEKPPKGSAAHRHAQSVQHSLSALALTLKMWADTLKGRSTSVPYRTSSLTWALSSSLRGLNSIHVIACLLGQPSAAGKSTATEDSNALKFVTRLKRLRDSGAKSALTGLFTSAPSALPSPAPSRTPSHPSPTDEKESATLSASVSASSIDSQSLAAGPGQDLAAATDYSELAAVRQQLEDAKAVNRKLGRQRQSTGLMLGFRDKAIAELTTVVSSIRMNDATPSTGQEKALKAEVSRLKRENRELKQQLAHSPELEQLRRRVQQLENQLRALGQDPAAAPTEDVEDNLYSEELERSAAAGDEVHEEKESGAAQPDMEALLAHVSEERDLERQLRETYERQLEELKESVAAANERAGSGTAKAQELESKASEFEAKAKDWEGKAKQLEADVKELEAKLVEAVQWTTTLEQERKAAVLLRQTLQQERDDARDRASSAQMSVSASNATMDKVREILEKTKRSLDNERAASVQTEKAMQKLLQDLDTERDKVSVLTAKLERVAPGDAVSVAPESGSSELDQAKARANELQLELVASQRTCAQVKADVSRLQSELEASKNKLAQLQQLEEDCATQKKQCDSLKVDLESTKAELTKAQQQLKQVQSSRAAVVEELAERCDELEKAEARAASLQKELEQALRKDRPATTADVGGASGGDGKSKDSDGAGAYSISSPDEVTTVSLQKQLEQSQERAERLHVQLAREKEALAAMEKERDTHADEAKASREDVQRLEKELQAALAELSAAKQAVDSKQIERASKEEEEVEAANSPSPAGVQQQLEEARKDVASRQQEIVALRKQLDQTVSERSDVQASLRTASEQLAQLQQLPEELQEAKSQLAQVQAKLEEAVQEQKGARDAQALEAKHEKARSAWRQELADARQALGTAQRELEEARGEVSRLNNEAARANELTQQVAALKQEVRALQEEVKDKAAAVATSVKDKKQLDKERAELRNELDKAIETQSDLTRRLSTMEDAHASAVADLQQQLEELTKTNASLSETLSRTSDTHSAAVTAAEQSVQQEWLQKQREWSAAEAALRKQLAAQRQSFDELTATAAKLEDQVASLQEALKNAEASTREAAPEDNSMLAELEQHNERLLARVAQLESAELTAHSKLQQLEATVHKLKRDSAHSAKRKNALEQALHNSTGLVDALKEARDDLEKQLREARAELAGRFGRSRSSSATSVHSTDRARSPSPADSLGSLGSPSDVRQQLQDKVMMCARLEAEVESMDEQLSHEQTRSAKLSEEVKQLTADLHKLKTATLKLPPSAPATNGHTTATGADANSTPGKANGTGSASHGSAQELRVLLDEKRQLEEKLDEASAMISDLTEAVQYLEGVVDEQVIALSQHEAVVQLHRMLEEVVDQDLEWCSKMLAASAGPPGDVA